MGAKEMNFHNQVIVRMGYEDLAAEVQELYLNGEKDRATALIPDELVDDMHIIGTAPEVKERVAQWEETGVTRCCCRCTHPTRCGRSRSCSLSSSRAPIVHRGRVRTRGYEGVACPQTMRELT